MKRSGFCDGWEFSRDGSGFSPVVVPHDAMLGNRRDADAPAGSASGYFYGGSSVYRKRFSLTAEQAARHLLLEFEGVYRDARIHVNGEPVEAPPYGFVPFFIDITGLVHAGENMIEVAADNTGQPDCRWYSGAGLYRPVWLWESGDERIEPEGVCITTVSLEPALIQIHIEHVGGAPVVHVLDPEGTCVAEGRGSHLRLRIPHAQLWSAETPALYRCVVTLERTEDGANAALSPEVEAGAHTGRPSPSSPAASADRTSPPALGHALEAEVEDALDRTEVRFGIRTLSWTNEGFFVNGRETLLRGGCIHCDNGILGAASFPESEWRRVRLLKEAGFNALRVAHNPAPAALLDACDELGMYVMDEAWDMWYTPKSAHDYARHFLDWCDLDLERLVSRDYNHPSVIMYSIGNEVADPIAPEGVALERSLVDLLHSIDPTRPVTCGLNLTMMVMERAGRGWYGSESGVSDATADPGAPRGSLLFNLAAQATGTGMTLLANAPGADKLVSPALDALDIAGYNYAAARYAVDARKHPQRLIVGSETFPYELPRNWKAVREIPNVIGDFQWAAWDYLGEAGAGAWAYTADEAGFSKPWPWLFAGSGALDIFGNPNAHAALAGAVWQTAQAPSIQVRPVNRMKGRTYKATWRGSDAIPSWSWNGCAGTTTTVEVYDGRAHAVRLELNGEVLGQKRIRNYVARFTVAYQPGTLVAIAIDENGCEIGASNLASACAPFHLDVRPEAERAPAGGVAYVAISIRGANGEIESNADEQLTVQVEDGELLAFGSAQPAPTESFLAGTYTTYRGRAMAVVHRSTPGTARLTVRSGRDTTLEPITVELQFA